MSTSEAKRPKAMPAQQQKKQPGVEHVMTPRPQYRFEDWKGSDKLKDKVAIITGGDSGIGRAVAILFAKEGCDVVISYLDEHKDAEETKKCIEELGRRCILVAGDIGRKAKCEEIVNKCVETFGRVDILVNNAAVQVVQENPEDISEEQLEKVFRTNIFSFFFLTQLCLPHMPEGSAIVNSSSVNAFKGHKTLVDYTSTKGAITAFTRAMALNLAERKIRVNNVAPGPIWTPLIPASFDAEHVKDFGKNVLLQRAGQPEEVAPSYLFLACNQMSSYITGQTVHPNGGYIVGA
jgi:NAD(P)-dependent dehydrogenase (short-subunit alcohol dehydrogenase family)